MSASWSGDSILNCEGWQGCRRATEGNQRTERAGRTERTERAREFWISWNYNQNNIMRLATPPLPEPPFARSYWAVPGQILAGFYPGDRNPVVALHKLKALLVCGVTHVCSLMERTETDHAGRPFEDYRPAWFSLARQRGGKAGWMHYPIRDVSVPAVPQMTRTLGALDAVLAGGGVVYLHCWGGRGRTGTVLGCWLARHGERDPLTKLRQLTARARQQFPQVPETRAQQQFVLNWRVGP